MSLLIDIADGIRDKWATVTALNTAIPVGRVYYGEAPASASLPYAVIECEQLGDRQWMQPCTSGSSFLVRAQSTVRVFSTGFEATFGPAVTAVVNGLFNEFAIDNSTHMACFVQNEAIAIEGMRDGETIYRGDVVLEHLLSRVVP